MAVSGSWRSPPGQTRRACRLAAISDAFSRCGRRSATCSAATDCSRTAPRRCLICLRPARDAYWRSSPRGAERTFAKTGPNARHVPIRVSEAPGGPNAVASTCQPLVLSCATQSGDAFHAGRSSAGARSAPMRFAPEPCPLEIRCVRQTAAAAIARGPRPAPAAWSMRPSMAFRFAFRAHLHQAIEATPVAPRALPRIQQTSTSPGRILRRVPASSPSRFQSSSGTVNEDVRRHRNLQIARSLELRRSRRATFTTVTSALRPGSSIRRVDSQNIGSRPARKRVATGPAVRA